MKRLDLRLRERRIPHADIGNRAAENLGVVESAGAADLHLSAGAKGINRRARIAEVCLFNAVNVKLKSTVHLRQRHEVPLVRRQRGISVEHVVAADKTLNVKPIRGRRYNQAVTLRRRRAGIEQHLLTADRVAAAPVDPAGDRHIGRLCRRHRSSRRLLVGGERQISRVEARHRRRALAEVDATVAVARGGPANADARRVVARQRDRSGAWRALERRIRNRQRRRVGVGVVVRGNLELVVRSRAESSQVEHVAAGDAVDRAGIGLRIALLLLIELQRARVIKCNR